MLYHLRTRSHNVRAGAKVVRYVNLVRQVPLENVVRVSFDAVKKVVVCGVE